MEGASVAFDPLLLMDIIAQVCNVGSSSSLHRVLFGTIVRYPRVLIQNVLQLVFQTCIGVRRSS